jgi:hypothetical protein
VYLLALLIFLINFKFEPLNSCLAKASKETSAGARADAGGIDKAEKSINAKDKNKSSDLLLRAEIIRIFENLHQLLLCE